MKITVIVTASRDPSKKFRDPMMGHDTCFGNAGL